MRERRKAEDEAQDDEWEVWRPPPQVFAGLVGSHCFSGPSPVASYRSRKNPGVHPRWTKDDLEEE